MIILFGSANKGLQLSWKWFWKNHLKEIRLNFIYIAQTNVLRFHSSIWNEIYFTKCFLPFLVVGYFIALLLLIGYFFTPNTVRLSLMDHCHLVKEPSKPESHQQSCDIR